MGLTLTAGEARWLDRKRAGTTVLEAARARGLDRAAYVELESDATPVCAGGYDLSDVLRALRRRSSMGRDVLAAMLGVSHVTWLKWERRADPRIVAFWRDYPWVISDTDDAGAKKAAD